jgi:hypothetical protein
MKAQVLAVYVLAELDTNGGGGGGGSGGSGGVGGTVPDPSTAIFA